MFWVNNSIFGKLFKGRVKICYRYRIIKDCYHSVSFPPLGWGNISLPNSVLIILCGCLARVSRGVHVLGATLWERLGC